MRERLMCWKELSVWQNREWSSKQFCQLDSGQKEKKMNKRRMAAKSDLGGQVERVMSFKSLLHAKLLHNSL